MNVLNGVWWDIYILQIIIQQKLERLTKILQDFLILKIQNFQSKLEIFIKVKKRIASILVFLFMKIRQNIRSVSLNTFKHQADLLLIGEEFKKHYVLL